jgi:2,4-dienoyl-CoA reductase-like NADH-dependent reductase (Old Yellow Enzyme family)
VRHLFTSYDLAGCQLKNRIWVAPMAQYSAEEGLPNDWHFTHLGSLARGGASLVFAEATAVLPEGRTSPNDTGLWNDAQEAAWARCVALIKAVGAKSAIQLGHAGRKASTSPPWEGMEAVPNEAGGWTPVGPDDHPYPGLKIPEPLDHDGIKLVVQGFFDATRRAARAGFDAIELHAAHGYLAHQFLSPLSNSRTDDYGYQSFENRCRFVLEVVRAMKAAAADIPVLVRLSATDYLAGGWGIDDTVRLARLLRAEGVALVDLSSGGNEPAQIPIGPGYQVRFADRVRHEAGIPTAAVGLITELPVTLRGGFWSSTDADNAVPKTAARWFGEST